MSRRGEILKQMLPAVMCLGIYACAQVVSPNGGPKDVKPPKLVKVTPANGSILFNSKSILLEFDEYVAVRDAASQLVVSPPLTYPPVVKEKGKTLRVAIKDTLLENTTYTFNFGRSIVDITEGNVLEDFQYVVSTGKFIDSLFVKGHVDFAENHKTEKGILVMLYDERKYKTDSFAFKQLPSYFGKTTASGNFKITNIRQGKYKALAIKDANNNFKYDAPDEYIAFSDSVYSLDSNATVQLSLFQQVNPRFFVKSAKSYQYGEITFAFNKPAEALSLEPLNASFKKAWYIEEFSRNRDSLSLWLTDIITDTLRMKIAHNGLVTDTVEIALAKKDNSSKPVKGGKGMAFALQVKTNATKEFNPGYPLALEFNHPVKEYDITKVMLKQGGKDVKTSLEITDKASRKFRLLTPAFLPDSNYSLLVLPGAFTDIFDLKNDTVKAGFRVQKEDAFGTLKLKVSMGKSKGNYLFQLLDEKGNVVKEESLKGSQELFYRHLQAGPYMVKLIYDRNGNGKWDTGDYRKGIQPEKTVYGAKNYVVRSGWDLEEEWVVE
jgi:uncharacterized protein (DUF2141 family)